MQAHQSCLGIAAEGAPESMAVPVLIVGSDADKLVDPKAIRQIAKRLPHGELVMFAREAAHEILRETDAVRDAALANICTFLGRIAPAQ